MFQCAYERRREGETNTPRYTRITFVDAQLCNGKVSNDDEEEGAREKRKA